MTFRLEIADRQEPDEFMECDTCRAKTGSPPLCSGCLHNRALIGRLAERNRRLAGLMAGAENMLVGLACLLREK